MDQAKLAELAPDIADDFTAETVNNQIDAMPVIPTPTPPPEPTRLQKKALWNLFKVHPKAIEQNNGVNAMSRVAGIHPRYGRSLISQFVALVAYRKSEATPAPAKKAKASK